MHVQIMAMAKQDSFYGCCESPCRLFLEMLVEMLVSHSRKPLHH